MQSSHHVVASRNLFVDTASDLHGGTGDNVTIQLGANRLHAGDGQLLKLSLLDFSMYRNFHMVNANNNKARLIVDGGAAQELVIPPSNYATLGDITAAFAAAAAASMLAAVQAAGSGATTCTVLDALPVASDTLASTGDRIMSFQLSFDAAHGATAFALQCLSNDGESYAILGGDRVDDAASGASSLTCTVPSATVVQVLGRYPMQRHTDHHVYLRCDLPSTNLETASLSGGGYNTHTLGSNIVGYFETDVEYVHFTSQTSDEFTLLLTTRTLSALRLYLTDSRNRPLARQRGSASQTAAGTGAAQSTLGNLGFKALLRLDVVQAVDPQQGLLLRSRPVPQTVPATKLGLLTSLPTE